MDTGQRAEPDTTATCVVVRPMGAPLPPPQLMEALKARAFETVHCDDVYESLARLCLLVARRGDARRAVSLVVIDQQQIGEMSDFLEAIETYVPSVVPWDYDDEAGLRPLVIEKAQSSGTEPTIHVQPSQFGPPRLRLSEDLTPEPATELGPPERGDAEEDADDPSMSQLLTDEELEMLLDDDEPPASTNTGDRT